MSGLRKSETEAFHPDWADDFLIGLYAGWNNHPEGFKFVCSLLWLDLVVHDICDLLAFPFLREQD